MTREAVTVVVPTTGRGRGFGAAIDSVLSQRDVQVQLVAVVDGRPVDTGDRASLRHLRGQHTVVQIDAVANPAIARNIGLSLSRNRWVAFLDDDDLWEPYKLARQLTAAHSRPGTVLVASNAWRSVHGVRSGLYHPALPATVGLRDLLRTNWIITSTALADAAALARVGGFPADPACRYVEDYSAWLKLAIVGYIHVLPDALARYSIAATQSYSSGDVLTGDEARRRAVAHARESVQTWSTWRTLRARRILKGAA